MGDSTARVLFSGPVAGLFGALLSVWAFCSGGCDPGAPPCRGAACMPDLAHDPCGGLGCPLGCNSGEKRCYRAAPGNVPAPYSQFLPDSVEAALEIGGTAYLDVKACQLRDDKGPAFAGLYRGTPAVQQPGFEQEAPVLCVVGVAALRIAAGGKLVVYSSKEDSPTPSAAVVLARGDIDIAGTIDARAGGKDHVSSYVAGPGGYWGAHGLNYSQKDACGGKDASYKSSLTPGGGGGAHATAGGSGGSPNDKNPGGAGGVAPAMLGDELHPLRGGCGGGLAGQQVDPGEGGGGGGALQLFAAGTLAVRGGAVLDVSGSGARGGAATGGGAGGGAGGGILLEAGTVRFEGLLLAGGGGGGGGDQPGGPGAPQGGGPGGKPAGSAAGGGGAGRVRSFAEARGAGDAGQDGQHTGTQGGGGGGGLGRVRINAGTAAALGGQVVAVTSQGIPELE